MCGKTERWRKHVLSILLGGKGEIEWIYYTCCVDFVGQRGDVCADMKEQIAWEQRFGCPRSKGEIWKGSDGQQVLESISVTGQSSYHA